MRGLLIPGIWLFRGGDVSVPAQRLIERLWALAATGKPFEYKHAGDTPRPMHTGAANEQMVAVP
jgi:hypothetical protein